MDLDNSVVSAEGERRRWMEEGTERINGDEEK